MSTLLLIITAKLLRMLGSGIITVIFFVNLQEKNAFQENPQYKGVMYLIQAGLYFGTFFTSSLIKKYQSKIGTKNALLLASLLMIFSSIALTEIQNLQYFAIMVFLGMIPIVGQDIEFFSSIQQASLTKILTKKHHQTNQQTIQTKQKLSFELYQKVYKVVGLIAQIAGIYFTSRYLLQTKRSLQIQDIGIMLVVRSYVLLCFLQFIIYYLTDQTQLSAPKQKQLPSQSYNQQQIKESNTKPGFFILLTFMVFLCTNILNVTNCLYFVHEKYSIEITDVAVMIIGLIMVSYFGGYLAQKMVEKGYAKTGLFLGIPFNLLFIHVAATYQLRKIQSLIFMANFITNQIIIKIWQQLQYRIQTQGQNQSYKDKIERYRSLGSTISIILFAIFCYHDSISFDYATTIVICGVGKTIISIAMLLCYPILDTYSFNSQSGQYLEGNHLQEHTCQTQVEYSQEVDQHTT